jgi:hypothetical protein
MKIIIKSISWDIVSISKEFNEYVNRLAIFPSSEISSIGRQTGDLRKADLLVVMEVTSD